MWTDSIRRIESHTVQKFKDIDIGFKSGFVLVVNSVEPFSYSVMENRTGVLQFPYMLSVLNFTSRRELTDCISKAMEAYCRETGRFDVEVLVHSSNDDAHGLRSVMVAYDISDTSDRSHSV